MSEDVTYRGRLIRVDPEGLTVEEKAEELLGGSLEDYYSSYLDKLLDEEDYLYLKDRNILLKIEKTKWENGAFCEIEKDKDGNYLFFTQFYNGGASLEEVLEDGIEDHLR